MKKYNIKELRNQISIVDVISNYLKLTRKGNNYAGLCPFHQDNHASLFVNENKKIFKCFACNVAGDAFSFIQKIDHLSYQEAIYKACELTNQESLLTTKFKEQLKIDSYEDTLYKINEQANSYFKMFLDNKENISAKQYLLNRGFNEALIKKFEIGFAPKDRQIILDLLINRDCILNSNQAYNLEDIKQAGLCIVNREADFESYFYNRITFPIYDQYQHLVGFSARVIDQQEPKYLNTATTKIFNKSEILYNIQNVINNDLSIIYILEGFMDVIALSKIGVNDCVATMGVALTKQHIEILKQFSNLKSIVLCFDNDQAGRDAIHKAADLLKKYFDVYIVNYLDDAYKDFDELVNKNIELAKKTINNIINYDSYIIKEKIKAIKNVNNEIEKNNLFNDLINELKHINNQYIQIENLKNVSNELNISFEILLGLIQINSKQNKTYNSKNLNKKYTNNELIDFNNCKKQKLEKVNPVENIEKEILLFCLKDKKYEKHICENISKIYTKWIKSIIDKISNFYFENEDVTSFIDNEDETKIQTILNNNFSDFEKSFITNNIKKVKQQNEKFCLEKLNQILETHTRAIVNLERLNLWNKLQENKMSRDEVLQNFAKLNDKLKK